MCVIYGAKEVLARLSLTSHGSGFTKYPIFSKWYYIGLVCLGPDGEAQRLIFKASSKDYNCSIKLMFKL